MNKKGRNDAANAYEQPSLTDLNQVASIELAGRFDSLNFSPDGQLVAVGTATDAEDTSDVIIFSTQTWKRVHQFELNDTLAYVQFSPNGSILAASGFLGTIGIWEIETGAHRFTLPGRGPVSTGMCFSPDSNRIVVTGTNDLVIWDLADSKKIREWTVDKHGLVNAVEFHPSKALIITAGESHIIRFWNSESGEPAFSEDAGSGLSFSLSPDGSMIATVSMPRLRLGETPALRTGKSNVRLYSVDEGKLLYALPNNGFNDTCVAFSANGKLVAVGVNYWR